MATPNDSSLPRREFLQGAIALGALPIALSLGAASTSRIGMGVVIVGGTIFSLILTLFVIPAIYMMWSRPKKHRPEFDTIKDV